MPSAECHTDYHLVRCKLWLHFKPKPRKGGPHHEKVQSEQTSVSWSESWLSSRYTVLVWKQRLPRRNSLGSTEECHSADIWWSSGVYHPEEQRLIRREQPRDSGIAKEEEIIPPSPSGSAVMVCEKGCLPSHLQHPPAQASRDPKWVVDQSRKENSAIRIPRWLQRFLQSPQGSVWLDPPGPESICAVKMGLHSESLVCAPPIPL